MLSALGLVASLLFAGWQMANELLLSRSISEGRTVADMAEGVGRWASQYGGLYARTEGVNAPIPGAFLTRSVYASSSTSGDLLQGVKTETAQDQRQAMDKLETYHWKNPALIQREVADTLANSGSRLLYRMTARSVLNPNNAPNPFELEALGAIQKSFARLTPDELEKIKQRGMSASQQTDQASPMEYWQVAPGRLMYARAVIAQPSCLKCHGSAETAPAFLRENQMFNGGGGFGYEAGKPVGVISINVPMPPVMTVIEHGMSRNLMAALLLAGLFAVGVLVLGLRLLLAPSQPRP